jgi:hypothetical protein
MKIVYIAHPISGDIEKNLEKIIGIIREINLTEPHTVPFAHYWVDCHALNDNIPEERQRGIDNDMELFGRGFIDELWIYGDRLSNGMIAEIDVCLQLNIPIVFKSTELINKYSKP